MQVKWDYDEDPLPTTCSPDTSKHQLALLLNPKPKHRGILEISTPWGEAEGHLFWESSDLMTLAYPVFFFQFPDRLESKWQASFGKFKLKTLFQRT
jgi:hypothetical protein